MEDLLLLRHVLPFMLAGLHTHFHLSAHSCSPSISFDMESPGQAAYVYVLLHCYSLWWIEARGAVFQNVIWGPNLEWVPHLNRED